eukprot:447481-Pelagomonas_calceolata.AAC.2
MPAAQLGPGLAAEQPKPAAHSIAARTAAAAVVRDAWLGRWETGKCCSCRHSQPRGCSGQGLAGWQKQGAAVGLAPR